MKRRGKTKSKISKSVISSVRGVIRGTGRGYAFLSYDGGDDVFVPPDALAGAIHGDTVDADLYADHAEVRRIVKIGFAEITGVYVREMYGRKVIPDDRHFSRDITVTGGSANIGDRVAVRLSRKDRSKGEIVAVLGKAGTLASDVAAVVFSLGIDDFGMRAIREADQAAARPIEIGGRRDLTQQACFTIDGDDSKDFDDAVYAERTDGGYRLWVHIADVAEYVPLNGYCDREAFRRGNSFYYGENVIPMLPEVLCNGVCSLNEDELRYTLTVILDFDESGERTGGEVCEAVIRSKKRMTYRKAQATLDGGDDYAPFAATLAVLKELSDKLRFRRDEAGNINFDLSEPEFVFRGDEVTSVSKKPILSANILIEECMIAANRFVAEKFHAEKAPFVYRVHKPPQEDRLESLNDYLAAMGLGKADGTSVSISRLLSSAPPDKRNAVGKMALRSMSKAVYSTTCSGHFGLALDEYCHFTSPIRRYSDLTVHRVIKAKLHGEDVAKFKATAEAAASQATERERLCDAAEREIDDLYIADYMSHFVGKRFVGIVSGVTEWAIFIELDFAAEGMIRADTLGETQFDPRTMSMTVRGKGRFSLGDRIEAKLTAVSGPDILFEL